MDRSGLFLLYIASCLTAPVLAQLVFNCPSEWYPFQDSCFLFQGDIPQDFDHAKLACSDYGASLTSVLNREMHDFIKNWLDRNDPFLRSWYTSGSREKVDSLLDDTDNRFVWEGSGRNLVEQGLSFWNGKVDRNHSNGVIVYSVGEGGYGWDLATPDKQLPFICEVPKAEAFRVIHHVRDFDYGLTVYDENKLVRGPRFLLQPVSTVVVGSPTLAQLECNAFANPSPSYRWFRGLSFKEEVTSSLDSRYTVTNGKLIIQNPDELKDAGKYRCTAENRVGRVLSNEVQLSFGALSEFSNVPDAAVNARAYDGVAIQCSKITFKPAVKYQWYKESSHSFVRPAYQTYQFMSQNGKLYFSEVTRADEGRYHCIAILSGVNRHTIGTSQPPTRTSLPIQLVVHDQPPKADWGPIIQDDFIAVFPQPPLKGQDVRLECFAYGSSETPFLYSWQREGKPIPERAVLSDSNRVLTILEAALEDAGTYTCTVMRSSNSRDSKSIFLSLGSRPYFISPLRDQHVDVSSQVTWRCDARGNPTPTYLWFKDGEPLFSSPEQGVVVHSNVLRISKVEAAQHEGMYQCGAKNIYGTTLSEGQLRVLAFAPTFYKRPPPPHIQVALRGNATITCQPEGAPQPLVTWYKGGVFLTPDGNHVIQLPNGNLLLRDVQASDVGRYTCRAENEFGMAESSTTISTSAGTFITMGPRNEQVSVNETAFLTCEASSDPRVELVFSWYFNGYLLDPENDPDFHQVSKGASGHNGLYVKFVDLRHAGYYECYARTTLSQDRKGALLTVLGPPSEPTGCFVDDLVMANGTVEVLWLAGASNGHPIALYSVEIATSYEPDRWISVYKEIPSKIPIKPENQKLRATVKDIAPGNGYRFRVIAFNHFGPSRPSLPSSWIYMTSAPPRIPPHRVGGGGGSIGELTITWTPLEPFEESGPGIGYRAYWRRYGFVDGLWQWHEKKGLHDHYVTFVGAENYFLEYEVKVQAFNELGYGPNSSSTVIFSAEDLPLMAVTDVRGDGLNGSASQVTWTQVPSTREHGRGIILGYQINYWLMGKKADDYKEFVRVEGHVGEGIFIGLESNTFYYVEVLAYNSAGLGPPSTLYLIESKLAPAESYPEEIRVYSVGHGQVKVWWRGIHINWYEANIHGFVIYFWPANEHYRTACEMIIHDHHAHEAHLTVDPGVIYALRVSAYSQGGHGKKTPVLYFTLEGEVTIDRAFAQEIDVFLASASTPSLSLLLLLCACVLCLLNFR